MKHALAAAAFLLLLGAICAGLAAHGLVIALCCGGSLIGYTFSLLIE